MEASMYSTILVPLDGSTRAEAILRHVELLAQRFQSKVVFLQVIEASMQEGVVPPSRAVPDAGLRRLRSEEVDNYLAGWEGEFREKGIDARRIAERGPVVETIINVAEREGADLIAMASHGRTGLERVFYGSVAVGVLHHVDRPLLLVRSRRLG
jgi:nucleotide-binding universal stress UspA family protein